jgi:hypothetical protein
MTRLGDSLQVGPTPSIGSYELKASAGDRLAHPPHHPLWEGVTAKPRHHEATSPRMDLVIIHLSS